MTSFNRIYNSQPEFKVCLLDLQKALHRQHSQIGKYKTKFLFLCSTHDQPTTIILTNYFFSQQAWRVQWSEASHTLGRREVQINNLQLGPIIHTDTDFINLKFPCVKEIIHFSFSYVKLYRDQTNLNTNMIVMQ